MDFRNLCQKLDVDGLKAKIPALPQLRLPKALPKLKSRKIFRSSRDNVNESGKNSPRSQGVQGGGGGGQPMSMMTGTHSMPPPSDFINHTPKRISTISSLMHEHGVDGGRGAGMTARSTYRSACSIDDDYPSPTAANQRASRPISPIRLPNSPCNDAAIGGDAGANGRMSFIEQLQKGYKDITEFRLKHIFAKKTVVRRDNIKVDDYVLQYDEERRLEQLAQERRDRKIADNYNINFTLSNTRQNTLDDDDDDNDSLRGGNVRQMAPAPPRSKRVITNKAGKTTKSSVGEHSGDESGMEATPPSRKPGIAATRFARVRSPPLHMASVDGGGENEATPPKTLAEKNTSKSSAPSGGVGGYRQQLRRFKEYMSSQEEPTAEQQPSTEGAGAAGGAEQVPSRSAKLLAKLPSLGRNKSIQATTGDTSAVESEAEQKEATNVTNKPLDTIKQNLKRLHKSIKRGPSQQQQQHQQKRAHTATDDESDDDDNDDEKEESARKSNQTTTKPTRTARFAAQLRRFRSTEEVTETQQEQQSESQGLGGKLQTWKKSFKKRGASTTMDAAATTGDESSPEKQRESTTKRPGTLMKKLKHIRSSRKATTTASNSELDRTDDGAATADEADGGIAKTTTRGASTTRKNIEERLAHARDKTMKKVNEKMQQMKFFHKSQEQVDSNASANVNSTRAPQETPTQKRQQQYNDEADYNSSDEDEDDLHVSSKMAGSGGRHSTLSPPSVERRHCLPSDYQQYYTNQNEIEPIDPIQAAYASKERRIGGSASYGTMGSSNNGGGGLTAWTTKPILCGESLDSDVDSEFPRVLIHQDHSDAFESTLIIAVTRPASASPIPSARISEILTGSEEDLKSKQRRCAQTPPPSLGRGPHQWVSNDKIISGFLEISSPPKMHRSRLSVSDLDDGIDRKNVIKKQKQKLDPWQVQTSSSEKDQQSLYKTKSIDIFEANARKGGAFEDFDDELRNEPIVRIGLTSNNVDSFEHDSSEDRDAPDDDNSSRVTKICVQAMNESREETTTKLVTPNVSRDAKGQFGNSRESLIAHMGEGHEQSDDDDDDEDEADEDNEDDEDDDDDDEGFINDRPPSSAPSPPPSCSPPPPPLPERRLPPSQVRMEASIPAPPTTPAPMLPTSKSLENYDYDVVPPPLPTSKPPLPPSNNNNNCSHDTALPKIPERTASINRPGKPLVKTSSLRLAYSEQVNPGDVGKVNKLISRFEPPGKRTERPRIIQRRLQSQESEEYSDYEIEEEESAVYDVDIDKRDTTPTPAVPVPAPAAVATVKHSSKTTTTTTTTTKVVGQTSQGREQQQQQQQQQQQSMKLSSASNNNNSNNTKKVNSSIPQIVTTRDLSSNNNYTSPMTSMGGMGMGMGLERHTSDLSKSSSSLDRKNSNCSRSEYGSPLTYPSSLRGSNETTPVPERKPQPQMDLLTQQRNTTRRSRHSMTRDDENFYSFDSDEENSYYSISPSGSSRYVVEI